MPARPWFRVLSDPAVLASIEEATRICDQQACAHEHRDSRGKVTNNPAYCNCRESLIHAVDFHQWLELEVRMRTGNKYTKPAGNPKQVGSRRTAAA